MTKKEYKELLKSDYLRYNSDTSLVARIKTYMMKPGYAWSHWYRKLCYLNSKPLLKPLAFLVRLKYHNICVKYGIDIPSHIPQIGAGFKIEHFCLIMVHTDVVIGKNVTLRQGVIIGTNEKGVPTIEDGVDFGACSIVLGPVTVGANAVIGAHAVVTHDVPAGATVVGNPAKILKK